MVYFIANGTHVKIGFAGDVKARLSSLQTASAVPLELLAEIDGDKEEERRQHAMWSHLHVRGEWFEAAADLLAYINELNGIPTIAPDPKAREQAERFGRVVAALNPADLLKR